VTSLVCLNAADAALELAPATGGAIASFTWRGVPVLRPTAPDMIAAGDVRRHACYPLVPYSNRIEHGRLAFDGRTHELALNFGDHPHSIHGVGWQRPWNVQHVDASSARLAFEHRPGSGDDGEERAWPWPFRATQWFQLAPAGSDAVALRMRLTVSNLGDETFPFGLGWHPFFACDESTTLQFSAKGVWETNDTMIPTRQVTPDGRFDFETRRAIGSTVLDNVYTGWTGKAQLKDRRAAREITLSGDTASPFFVVYIPPHHTFLAIEPVTQMTDAFNRAERGQADTGARRLAPGESFSCTMQIVAAALREDE